MKQGMLVLITAIFCSAIVGCATKNGAPADMPINDISPGGPQNMDYMYRSPPPAVAAQLAASPR